MLTMNKEKNNKLERRIDK